MMPDKQEPGLVGRLRERAKRAPGYYSTYDPNLDSEAASLLASKDAEIAALSAERDEWRVSATEFKGLCEEWQSAHDAAEATTLRSVSDEAVAALTKLESYLHGKGDEFGCAIARAALAHTGKPMEGKPTRVIYTNWRGETAEREIRPLYMWFGSTEWHPEPQWFVTAKDIGKGVERDFALKGFGSALHTGGETP